jgi:hypothetical protein
LYPQSLLLQEVEVVEVTIQKKEKEIKKAKSG